MAKASIKNTGNQEASVVHCVNETLMEHGNWPPPNDAAVMGTDYHYAEPSMKLFLNTVQTKLDNVNYKFSFSRPFTIACIALSVLDVKIRINGNTKPK